MRYCVKCGRQVEDSMNFCPSCGAQIPKEETHHTYEYGNGSACIFGTAGVCANFVGK